MDLKYFSLDEFDSPDEAGSGSKMCCKFLKKLDKIREDFGSPLHINSGYRTKLHNAVVGVGNSGGRILRLQLDRLERHRGRAVGPLLLGHRFPVHVVSLIVQQAQRAERDGFRFANTLGFQR